MGTCKFLWEFPLFLLIWLQMAHVPLPKSLWTTLKSLQKSEISHLSGELTNIKIWALLSFSRNFRLFCRIVYKWPSYCFLGLWKRFYQILMKLKVVTSVQRWLMSTFGYFVSFFYNFFSPNVYKWPPQRFSCLSKWFWKLSKNLEIVISATNTIHITLYNTTRITSIVILTYVHL